MHHETQSQIAQIEVTAEEWLYRWDNDMFNFSIEMGGLGPGYEQCIQIIAAEILRHLLDKKYDVSSWMNDKDAWERDEKLIGEYSNTNEKITKLQPTGAQWGSAVNLACFLYKGPELLFNMPEVKDRIIQVRKNFP